MMRKVVLFLLFSTAVNAQQVNDYMQSVYTGILNNPAYCGHEQALSAGMLHRSQWVRLEGAPQGNIALMHSPLRNKRLNAGFLIEQERFGVFRHTRLMGMYAYRTPFINGKLSFGLSAGADSYLSNWNLIRTTGGIDPRFADATTRTVTPQFAFGGAYEDSRLTVGFSFPQLYSNGGFYQLWLVNSAYFIPLSADFMLRPSALFRYVPASPVSVNGLVSLHYKKVGSLGVGYTSNQAFGAVLNMNCSPQLLVGYSYSQLTNKLGAFTGASHEIILKYTLVFKVASVSSRYY
jgi:type IX secretion system PorP/SprF family membrane protein